MTKPSITMMDKMVVVQVTSVSYVGQTATFLPIVLKYTLQAFGDVCLNFFGHLVVRILPTVSQGYYRVAGQGTSSPTHYMYLQNVDLALTISRKLFRINLPSLDCTDQIHNFLLALNRTCSLDRTQRVFSRYVTRK